MPETNRDHIYAIEDEEVFLTIIEMIGFMLNDETRRDFIRAWMNAPYDAGDVIWKDAENSAKYYSDKRELRRNGKEVD